VRCALVAFVVAVSAYAFADEVTPERQALILTRALAYDNNLKARAGEAVVIGVLHRADQSASKGAAEAIFHAWRSLDSVRVQDLPMKVVLVPYNRNDLPGTIANHGIDVLYVCPGLESELATIKELSRRQHLLTIGAREELVQAGLSLGSFQTDGKSVIAVNLPASREEGAAFTSELLRLARVIK
jgi:hypothetical protein